MSDIRICDGPNCMEKAILASDSLSFGSANADGYITVEFPRKMDLHFHNDACLRRYYAQSGELKVK